MCPDPKDDGVPRFEYNVSSGHLVEHRDYFEFGSHDESMIVHDPAQYGILKLSNTTKDAITFKYTTISDDRIHTNYIMIYKEIANAGLGSLFYDAGNDAVRIDQQLLQTIANYLRSDNYAGLTVAEFLEKTYGGLSQYSSLPR